MDTFGVLHPLWPPHYIFIARQCLRTLRNNSLKVRGGVGCLVSLVATPQHHPAPCPAEHGLCGSGAPSLLTPLISTPGRSRPRSYSLGAAICTAHPMGSVLAGALLLGTCTGARGGRAARANQLTDAAWRSGSLHTVSLRGSTPSWPGRSGPIPDPRGGTSAQVPRDPCAGSSQMMMPCFLRLLNITRTPTT